LPFAHPSLPRIDALLAVGMEIGISLLMTFHVASELDNPCLSHSSCFLPSTVLLL
jgi:hypothetical protein